MYDSRVWYLFVTRIFNALGFSVVLPFLSVYMHQEMNTSMSIIGSIFLISATGRASSQYLSGEIVDLWGRRGLLIIGAVGRVMVFVFLGFVVFYNFSFVWIGLGIVISYVFGGMFFTAADTMVSDIVVTDSRVEVYALQRIGINLGWAIGPAAAGLLAHLPFYSLFFITAFIFVIPVSLVVAFIKESKAKRVKEDGQQRIRIPFAKIKKFFLFCGFSLLVFSVMTQIISTMAVFSVEQIGISKSQLAFLFSLNGVIIVLFQFHTTRFIRRFPFTSALFTGAMLIAAGYFIVPFATGFSHLIFAIIFITFGEIFITPSGAALVSRWAPEQVRGRYFGIYGLFMAFGRSIGPFYGGILMDHLTQAKFLLWGIIAGVAVVAGFGFRWIGRLLPAHINKGT